MATWDSYDQGRQAEDVQDEIYIVSPVDNPVASMSKTIRATGVLHGWTEDKLKAPGVNALVEGADAADVAPNAVGEKSNYCQIMGKTVNVSGSLEEVDKYGRDSELAYQLELRYGELANDEEKAIVGTPDGTNRQTASAGTQGSAGRTMASLHNQLDAGVVVDAALDTSVPDLEDSLLSCHEAVYALGGNPNFITVNPNRVKHINSMAYAAGRERDIGNEKLLCNVVDLYVSSFGEMRVVLDRNQDDSLLLLDFNYLATPVLRTTADWPLAKTGDSDRRQVIREATFAVLNSESCGMVDNVPASLTLS